jgi:hypothetical protein
LVGAVVAIAVIAGPMVVPEIRRVKKVMLPMSSLVVYMTPRIGAVCVRDEREALVAVVGQHGRTSQHGARRHVEPPRVEVADARRGHAEHPELAWLARHGQDAGAVGRRRIAAEPRGHRRAGIVVERDAVGLQDRLARAGVGVARRSPRWC